MIGRFSKNKKVLLIVSAILTGIGLWLEFPINKKDPGEIFRTISLSCESRVSRGARMSCLEKELEPYAKIYGISPFIKELESSFIASDEASTGGISKCHDSAHIIGILGGKLESTVSKAFGQCTSICGYGCFMGVVDGYMAKGKNFLAEVDTLCGQSIHPLPCWHAVGHALVNRLGTLEAVFDHCSLLDDPTIQSQCVSGAFMEVYEFSGYGHEQRAIPEDMISYCDTVPPVGKAYCYTVSGYFTYRLTGDQKKAIGVCHAVPSDRFDSCIYMLSKNVYYDLKGSAQSVLNLCDSISGAKPVCIEGALFASVVSDPLARHGFELCNIADEADKHSCYAALGTLVQENSGSDIRNRLCSDLDVVYKRWCLEEKILSQ